MQGGGVELAEPGCVAEAGRRGAFGRALRADVNAVTSTCCSRWPPNMRGWDLQMVAPARRARQRRRRKGLRNNLAKKIRVYELARELGLTNKEGLELALSMGIGVTSHSSSIEEAQADRVRRRAEREGLKRAHPPEEAPAAPSYTTTPRPQRRPFRPV